MLLSLMKDWWVITVNSQPQRVLDSRAIACASGNGENCPTGYNPTSTSININPNGFVEDTSAKAQ